MAIRLYILFLLMAGVQLLSATEFEHVYPPDEGRVYYVNADANGTLYASTYTNTYVSLNNGETWTKKWNFRMLPGQTLNDSILVFPITNSYLSDNYEKLQGDDWELSQRGGQFGYYNIKKDELKILYAFDACQNCSNQHLDGLGPFNNTSIFYFSFLSDEGNWFFGDAAIQITQTGEMYFYQKNYSIKNALSHERLVSQYLDTLYITKIDSTKYAGTPAETLKAIPIHTFSPVKRINNRELLLYCYNEEADNQYFITYNAKTDMYYDSVSITEKISPFSIWYQHGLFNFGRDTIVTVRPLNKTVYYTINRGESWDSIALPGRYNYTWSNFDEPYFVRNKDYVFLSGFNGIYRLDLKNRTAEQVNKGLQAGEVTDVVADKDGTLYSIVRFGGVYKKKKDDTEWTEIPVMNETRDNVDYESIEILGDGRVVALAGLTYVSNEDKTAMYRIDSDTACGNGIDNYGIHFNSYYNSFYSTAHYLEKWNGACFKDNWMVFPPLGLDYQIRDYDFNKANSIAVIFNEDQGKYEFGNTDPAKQQIFFSPDDFKTVEPAYITTEEDVTSIGLTKRNILYLTDDKVVIPPYLISEDGGRSWEYTRAYMNDMEYAPENRVTQYEGESHTPTQLGTGTKAGKAFHICEENKLVEINEDLSYEYINLAKGEYKPNRVKLGRDKHVYVTMRQFSKPGILKSKDAFVSVEESNPAQQSDVLVYPNPASNRISLMTDLPISSIKLTDAFGNEYESISNPQNDMDVSSLPNGVYYLAVETATGTTLKKFIKVQ